MVFAALAPAALAVGVPGRSTPRDHGVVRVNYIRPSHKRRVFSSSASSCTAVPSRRVGVGVGMSHGRALVGTSTTRIVRLAAISSDGAGDFQSGESDDSLNKRNASSDSPIKFAGAPMDPGSSHGQMLAHVLSNETHLFAAAVEATLDKLTEEIDSEEQREGAVDVEGGAGDGARATAAAERSAGAGAAAASARRHPAAPGAARRRHRQRRRNRRRRRRPARAAAAAAAAPLAPAAPAAPAWPHQATALIHMSQSTRTTHTA